MTLEEVKNVKFSRARLGTPGYKASEVDDFITKVEYFIQDLEKKCSKQDEKVNKLSSELDKFRQDEAIFKDILIEARRSAEREISAAKNEAEIILREAKEKSKKDLIDNDAKIKEQEELLDNMKKEVTEFKSKLLTEYKNHLRSLSSLEKKGTNFSSPEIKISEIEKNDSNDIESSSIKSESAVSDSRTRILKKLDRLGGIKFGKNYDIKKDKESPLELFK